MTSWSPTPRPMKVDVYFILLLSMVNLVIIVILSYGLFNGNIIVGGLRVCKVTGFLLDFSWPYCLVYVGWGNWDSFSHYCHHAPLIT